MTCLLSQRSLASQRSLIYLRHSALIKIKPVATGIRVCNMSLAQIHSIVTIRVLLRVVRFSGTTASLDFNAIR